MKVSVCFLWSLPCHHPSESRFLPNVVELAVVVAAPERKKFILWDQLFSFPRLGEASSMFVNMWIAYHFSFNLLLPAVALWWFQDMCISCGCSRLGRPLSLLSLGCMMMEKSGIKRQTVWDHNITERKRTSRL